MSDEIESVLFVGREVMGECNVLIQGGDTGLTLHHSPSRPAADIHRRVQSGIMERSGNALEGALEGAGDWLEV